jgi:hypothetical protein
VHGVYAGVDSAPLLWLYLGTGLALLAVATWRYVARTPADLVEDLAASPQTAIRNQLRAVESATASRSTR